MGEKVPGTSGLIEVDKQGVVDIHTLRVKRIMPREGSMQIGLATTDKIGQYGKDPAAQQSALTTQLTTITHTAPAAEDFALQDFVDIGAGAGYAFKSLNEANTTMKVIANLQTRLAELETALKALGLLA